MKDVSIPDDLVPALPDLPLFPLHHAVLFPGALLPLHVFEPRYRDLVNDILGKHRTLCIPHLLDVEGADRDDAPIAEIGGIGTIVEHQPLLGGRANIMLLGRGRVRLQELRFRAPYRRAFATLLPTDDDPEDLPGVELAALHAAASAFTQLVRSRDEDFHLQLPKDASPGIVADAFAAHLVISPRERQAALETLDVRARSQRLTEVLTVQRASLAGPQDAVLN